MNDLAIGDDALFVSDNLRHKDPEIVTVNKIGSQWIHASSARMGHIRFCKTTLRSDPRTSYARFGYVGRLFRDQETWDRSKVVESQWRELHGFVERHWKMPGHLGGPEVAEASRILSGGWRWIYLGDGTEQHCLGLIRPDGIKAASVFLNKDVDHFNWFVWDEDGVGGENGGAGQILESKREAVAAVRRSRWHKKHLSNLPADW